MMQLRSTDRFLLDDIFFSMDLRSDHLLLILINNHFKDSPSVSM